MDISILGVSILGVKRPRMQDKDVDLPVPKQRRITDRIGWISTTPDPPKAKAKATISTYKSRPPPRPFNNAWTEARFILAREDEEERQRALNPTPETPDPWTPLPVRHILDDDHPEIVNRGSRFNRECHFATSSVNDPQAAGGEKQQPLLAASIESAATAETAEIIANPTEVEKENAKLKAEVSEFRRAQQEARNAKAGLGLSEKRVKDLEEEVKNSYRKGIEQGKKDAADEIGILTQEKEEKDGSVSTLQKKSGDKDNEIEALKRVSAESQETIKNLAEFKESQAATISRLQNEMEAKSREIEDLKDAQKNMKTREEVETKFSVLRMKAVGVVSELNYSEAKVEKLTRLLYGEGSDSDSESEDGSEDGSEADDLDDSESIPSDDEGYDGVSEDDESERDNGSAASDLADSEDEEDANASDVTSQDGSSDGDSSDENRDGLHSEEKSGSFNDSGFVSSIGSSSNGNPSKDSSIRGAAGPSPEEATNVKPTHIAISGHLSSIGGSNQTNAISPMRTGTFGMPSFVPAATPAGPRNVSRSINNSSTTDHHVVDPMSGVRHDPAVQIPSFTPMHQTETKSLSAPTNPDELEMKDIPEDKDMVDAWDGPKNRGIFGKRFLSPQQGPSKYNQVDGGLDDALNEILGKRPKMGSGRGKAPAHAPKGPKSKGKHQNGGRTSYLDLDNAPRGPRRSDSSGYFQNSSGIKKPGNGNRGGPSRSNPPVPGFQPPIQYKGKGGNVNLHPNRPAIRDEFQKFLNLRNINGFNDNSGFGGHLESMPPAHDPFNGNQQAPSNNPTATQTGGSGRGRGRGCGRQNNRGPRPAQDGPASSFEGRQGRGLNRNNNGGNGRDRHPARGPAPMSDHPDSSAGTRKAPRRRKNGGNNGGNNRGGNNGDNYGGRNSNGGRSGGGPEDAYADDRQRYNAARREEKHQKRR